MFVFYHYSCSAHDAAMMEQKLGMLFIQNLKISQIQYRVAHMVVIAIFYIQNKTSVAIYTSHTKTQLFSHCQQKLFHDHMSHPALCTQE